MRKSICLFLFVLQTSSLLAAQESAKITDWLGMGSGCRSRASDVRDLKMNIVQDPKDPLRLVVNFTMGAYELSGDKPITKENQSFARECALRFAIQPQPFTRIKSIEAKTDFLVNKDKEASAAIHSRLVTANGTLVDWESSFASGKELKNEKLAMNLVPNDEGKKILSQIVCGAPEILGADFTFENHRKSFKEKVQMKHDQPNQVSFIINLEPCGK